MNQFYRAKEGPLVADYDIRMVALDLDGTVFNNQKEITPRTLAAIRAALERGVAVLPATGRPLVGAPDEFLSIPGVEWVLTSNGGCVWRLAGRQPVVELLFSPAQAVEVLGVLAEFDCTVDLFADGRAYTTEAHLARLQTLVPPELLSYIRTSRHTVPDLTAFAAAGARVEKFSCQFGTLAHRQPAWQKLAALGYEVTCSLGTNIEINAPGVTKGAALLALAKHLGFAREQVMACGDSDNDAAMLQAAGLGVAMGNADPALKASADAVTATNEEDGVALALARYIPGVAEQLKQEGFACD